MRFSFGVEHERFLSRRNGDAPGLGDLKRLAQILEKRGWDSLPAGAAFDLAGPAEITGTRLKTDFCTNLLEVVLPPLSSLDTAKNFLLSAWRDVEDSAGQLDLVVSTYSALSQMPTNVVFAPSSSDKDGARISKTLGRPMPRCGWGIPEYPATIAATHVHIESDIAADISLLPSLYAVEYMVPLLFGNSTDWLGRTAHCVHPMVYRWNYRPSQLNIGFPRKIPTYVSETDALDRDYSLIVPRREFGTLEFRSACSQPTIDRVISLVAFRLAAVLAARDGLISPLAGMRQRFYRVALSGQFERELVEEHWSILLDFAGALGIADYLNHSRYHFANYLA